MSKYSYLLHQVTKVVSCFIYFVHSQIPKVRMTVDNLLLKSKDSWCGMKTVGQLRFEKKLKPPVQDDSLYKASVRFAHFQKHIDLFKTWIIPITEDGKRIRPKWLNQLV